MANWQNVPVQDDIAVMVLEGAKAAFKEATGQDMPEGFSNWSFGKRNGSFSYGIEMDAAAKALAKANGGNMPVLDAETRAYCEAWAKVVAKDPARLSEVDADVRDVVARLAKPTAGGRRMPEEAKPGRVMPATEAAPTTPPKGAGMVSSAALRAQMRRLEKARKAG